MNQERNELFLRAIQEVNSMIIRCEKIHVKFSVGTAQHTLLVNRLHALYVAQNLMNEKLYMKTDSNYTKAEYEKAMAPIVSIIHKCKKAQGKFEEYSKQYLRYVKTIENMELAKVLLEEKLLLL